jgi:WD40 repeat protein
MTAVPELIRATVSASELCAFVLANGDAQQSEFAALAAYVRDALGRVHVRSVPVQGLKRALSGAEDHTVRLWEVETGRCLRVLEGHTASVRSLAWSPDGQRALFAALNGVVRLWNSSAFVTEARAREAPVHTLPLPSDQVQYTNAKVLLVGDSGVGKTGLSNYLAHGIKVEDDKPLPSTDGA